jgi:hypothetical protein
MKNILILLTATLFLGSCKKEKIDAKHFWDCNAVQNFDSTKLAAKLIGSWQWTNQLCYLGKTTKADKNVEVSFTASGTFSVTENLVVITQGNWKLKNLDSITIGLLLDYSSEYLLGRILLCDNQVLFNASHADACDNLFVRK